MPTRWNRWFLLQILLLAQHVSGTIMPIIRRSRVLWKWMLPVVFGAWFSSCRYDVELRVVCPVCRQQPAFYFHILTTMHGQKHIKFMHTSFYICWHTHTHTHTHIAPTTACKYECNRDIYSIHHAFSSSLYRAARFTSVFTKSLFSGSPQAFYI